jgi:phytoene dehydrogenase-like protein
MTSIIIIGSGMGGLATGIYGQLNGFDTTIFEAHHQSGGQCTSWKRKGYVFDGCIHYFGGGYDQTGVNAFWREVGALPCEMVRTETCVSAVFPDGTWIHDYYDLEKLASHLKQLSPADAVTIDEYIDGIKRFGKNDLSGMMYFGSFWRKLSSVPVLLGLLKYFRYTLGTFGNRFTHPYLQKAFPLLHSSVPGIPLFMHLLKHVDGFNDGHVWPRGGSLTVSKNMAAHYVQLGGTIHYHKRVVKILTDNNQAYGVELEDGTQHTADFVVSNADGRKTIMHMLSGQYINEKLSKYCEIDPDKESPFAVQVFLGVKRDLSSYPSSFIMFLDEPTVIAGHTCDQLDMQIYGFDTSMAPAGKGVIKVGLFSRPSYFSRLLDDKIAYQTEKDKIAEQVITLLGKQFPGLREDIEVIDVATLHTWERFMGGTEGHNNFPNKGFSYLGDVLGLDQRYTLPGLKNFFLAGQWVTSAGALFLNALSGKTVVQKICKQCGVKFAESSDIIVN